jgi:hypothetical protein
VQLFDEFRAFRLRQGFDLLDQFSSAHVLKLP